MYAGSLLALKFVYINGGTNSWSANMQDKVIVITGANAGIGFECAMELSKMRPKAIVMACRDEKRGKDAVNAIKL
jgi:retinol dehydrogenase-12